MIKSEDQFLISMMVSLGISDFLKRYISGCKIKWPNDIYVNNDKIAGILIEHSIIENSILNSVAGIGLNINQRKFLTNPPNPVSMSVITGKEYDISSCLNELAGTLDNRYYQLKTGEHSEIRRDYISQLYRLNQWFDFRDSDSVFKGRILTIKNNGMLQIELHNHKVREYLFKEVDFIL
jgi:BirA family biotin operon repressor/biotin-[acetyl-CoA-carboxylase] ligase